MTRNRSSRTTLRLKGWERMLFIVGAVLYLVGFFGGVGLLSMPSTTVIVLLILGGGCVLAIILKYIF